MTLICIVVNVFVRLQRYSFFLDNRKSRKYFLSLYKNLDKKGKTETGMRLTLAENTTIKQARKAVRCSGFRLTVRNGCIYTIRAVDIKQPRSEKQQKNWEIMTEATRMADRDLKESAGKRYWMRRAKEEGYKTARGCARAYYIKMIKTGNRNQAEMVNEKKVAKKANVSIVEMDQKRVRTETIKVWYNSNKIRARVRKKGLKTVLRQQLI